MLFLFKSTPENKKSEHFCRSKEPGGSERASITYCTYARRIDLDLRTFLAINRGLSVHARYCSEAVFEKDFSANIYITRFDTFNNKNSGTSFKSQLHTCPFLIKGSSFCRFQTWWALWKVYWIYFIFYSVLWCIATSTVSNLKQS